MSSETKTACQKEACDLQACLNKNTYTPDKCGMTVHALYLCCQKFYHKNGEAAESTACPSSAVVKERLQAQK